jgi:hypothetical protein
MCNCWCVSINVNIYIVLFKTKQLGNFSKVAMLRTCNRETVNSNLGWYTRYQFWSTSWYYSTCLDSIPHCATALPSTSNLLPFALLFDAYIPKRWQCSEVHGVQRKSNRSKNSAFRQQPASVNAAGTHQRGGGAQPSKTPRNRNLNSTDFVDTMITDVLRDLPFSRIHALKSADD